MPNYKIYFTTKETTTGRLLEGDSCYGFFRTDPTDEQAIGQAKAVVENFNNTLRPKEEPREFVKLGKIERI